MEPTPAAVEAGSLNRWTAREVPVFMFKNLFIFGCIGSSLLHVAFSSCGERGVLLLVVVCGLLIVEVSLVAEHGL